MAGADWETDAVHGRSLMPLISDPEIPWRETVGTEFGGVNSLAMTQRTLRYEDLKYGYNCCCEDELYDLAMDPHETRNLIHSPDYRDAAADMRSRLVSWMEETGDPARRMFTWGRDYYPEG
jgi:hypothetical protein